MKTPSMATKIKLPADAYTVGLIYIKHLEMNAITVMLDERHKSIPLRLEDDNEYTHGRIGDYNVAVAGPQEVLNKKKEKFQMREEGSRFL